VGPLLAEVGHGNAAYCHEDGGFVANESMLEAVYGSHHGAGCDRHQGDGCCLLHAPVQSRDQHWHRQNATACAHDAHDGAN